METKAKASDILKLLDVADINELTPHEREIGERFIKFFPGRESDMWSYRRKPGCDCRFRIMKEFSVSPLVTRQFVDAVSQVIGRQILFDNSPDPAMAPPPGTSNRPTTKPGVGRGTLYSGRRIELTDTEEAWADFCRQLMLEGAVFDKMAIVPLAPDRIRVYFY